MILRRLAEHLKQQHWTAIAIELVIVVLGVFIGMQVSSWNEDRTLRSSETRHLQEIAEDLRADIAVFDEVRISALTRIGSIDYLLGETRGETRQAALKMPNGQTFDIPAGRPVSAANRDSLLSHVNLVRTTVGNRTGFEALIGAGGMRTLRDRAISRQIQRYFARMDDLISTQNTLRQNRNDGVQIGFPLGLSAFGDRDADALVGIVRGSPEYSAYLRTVREWAAIHLASLDQQEQLARTLLDGIDAYLGKSGAVVP